MKIPRKILEKNLWADKKFFEKKKRKLSEKNKEKSLQNIKKSLKNQRFSQKGKLSIPMR